MSTKITFEDAALAASLREVLAPFSKGGPHAGQIVTLNVGGSPFVAAGDGVTLRAIAPEACRAAVPSPGSYALDTLERVSRGALSANVEDSIETALRGSVLVELDRVRSARLLREWLREVEVEHKRALATWRASKASRAEAEAKAKAARMAAYQRELTDWEGSCAAARAAHEQACAAYKAGEGPKPPRSPALPPKPKRPGGGVTNDPRPEAPAIPVIVEIWLGDDGVAKLGRGGHEQHEAPMGRVVGPEGKARLIVAFDARLLLRALQSFNGPVARLTFEDAWSAVAVRDTREVGDSFAVVMPLRP